MAEVPEDDQFAKILRDAFHGRPKINKEQLMDAVFGDTPARAVAENRCVKPPMGCGEPIRVDRHTGKYFPTPLAKQEWRITGLCPACQARVELECPDYEEPDTLHLAPAFGATTLPCCGIPMSEMSKDDAMTEDSELVTCQNLRYVGKVSLDKNTCPCKRGERCAHLPAEQVGGLIERVSVARALIGEASLLDINADLRNRLLDLLKED